MKKRRGRLLAAVAAVLALAAVGILVGVLVSRDSTGAEPPTHAAGAPTLAAVVLQIERILRDSAASRRSTGSVLAVGFNCRIEPGAASRRLRTVVADRRDALRRVAALGSAPPAARRAVTLLETALNDSIDADVNYRNGFRYATGCPPTSDYFKAAARADRAATQAKNRFVAVFNPLAMRFGGKTWTAAAI